MDQCYWQTDLIIPELVNQIVHVLITQHNEFQGNKNILLFNKQNSNHIG